MNHFRDITSSVRQWYGHLMNKRIPYAKIYLKSAGMLHRLLVEGRRKRAAARRADRDQPLAALIDLALSKGISYIRQVPNPRIMQAIWAL